jgi:type II secretory ATPase GspE/PulE/Tfp pilus assembly ATPase PilB-like protein
MPPDRTAQPDAPQLVETILQRALSARASDVHFEPTGDGYEVRFRVDGLLEPADRFDAPVGRTLVTRLMVLAQLLTYRLDIPQEGRAALALPGADKLPGVDLRIAIMPTKHGLRAAVRLPTDHEQPQSLDQLGLPPGVLDGLRRFASGDTSGSGGGMLLVTGPAGSGKTTTLYALLRHIAETSRGLSIVSLEDPVERNLPGVTQIEVSPFGELTYERALRSILRQDPQVLMLGEIRDAATASLAIQAALSGHRLLSTLHAGTPGGAIARLLEMGLEPYQITSAVFAVVAQRLLRRKAPPEAKPGLGKLPGAGGYRGRVPIAEMALIEGPLRKAILDRADADRLQQAAAEQPNYQPLRAAAQAAIAQGLTDEPEVRRVLG